MSIKKAALLFIIGFGLAVIAGKGFAAENKAADYPLCRYLQYSFTLQNKTGQLLQDVTFTAYAPVKQTSSQYCEAIEASAPYQKLEDKQKNQFLQFSFRNIPPYAVNIINIKAALRFSAQPNPFPLEDLGMYLRPERYLESDNPDLIKTAAQFQDKGRISLAEKIYRWVSSWISYSGYLGNEQGALYALKNKKGDCTEYMSLFVALCRVKSIPARGLAGYVYNGNNIINSSEYHNWAEFYDGVAWRTVDAQKKIFAEGVDNFITLRIIGEDNQSPLQQSQRFRCSTDDVKVSIEKMYISTVPN